MDEVYRLLSSVEAPGAVEVALARALSLQDDVITKLEADMPLNTKGDVESANKLLQPLVKGDDMDRLMKDAYVCLYELEPEAAHVLPVSAKPPQSQPAQVNGGMVRLLPRCASPFGVRV